MEAAWAGRLVVQGLQVAVGFLWLLTLHSPPAPTSIWAFVGTQACLPPPNDSQPPLTLPQRRPVSHVTSRGCSVLRKYLGQLHYLQSRVPMGPGQEAAVSVTW